MYSTLAHHMRPEHLSDVLGQTHLLNKNGIISKMIEKKHPVSMIFYGPPGCGKTTLAKAIATDLNIPYRQFNASTGNKKDIDMIITEAKMSQGLFVIIDEIHRMNKDKQDHLLPYVESGLLIIAGCTTANPYHSINPAIRSRCTLLKVLPLEKEDIIEGLKRCSVSENGLNNQYTIHEDVYEKIAELCGGDIRYAYNLLELCTIISDNPITLEDLSHALPEVNVYYDKDEDQYYDTLSGLQKSIRGSDVNGALYYCAKLLESNDLKSLERRLITIAYEEVGLANPNACMRTVVALEGAHRVGMPEARILISQVIIDLALSPKSKSSENAIDEAIHSYRTHTLNAPEYIRLTPVGLDKEDQYDYSRPDIWEYLQYLPDEIKHEQFYVPWMTSQYEKALAENYRRILRHGRTPNIRELKKRKK